MKDAVKVVVCLGMKRIVPLSSIYTGTHDQLYTDCCVHGLLLSRPCRTCWEATDMPPHLQRARVVMRLMSTVLWGVIGFLGSVLITSLFWSMVAGAGEPSSEELNLVKVLITMGTLLSAYYFGWKKIR